MTERPYAGLRATFDTAAELYEQARPTYPDRLFTDLAVSAGLQTGPVRVLEIGLGTGQASRGLLARAWSVVGLEPGQELAAVARRTLAGLGEVDVVVCPFEQWQPAGPAPYDLVFAATSWHWLDPQVAYRRAAHLLGADGRLCQGTVGTAQRRSGEVPADGHENCPVMAVGSAPCSAITGQVSGQWPHPLTGEGLAESDAVAGGLADVRVVQ